MRATVQTIQTESKGMFSSKTSYSYDVAIQLHLEGDEQSIIDRYAPYQPNPIEKLKLDDYDRESLEVRLGKQGLLGFTSGVRTNFSSIQQAGRFEDAVLQAFAEFSGQISAARARASVLGERREIDIKH